MEIDTETGVRYLDEIVYERTPGGFAVPADERERWNNPPRFASPPRRTEQVQELQGLVVDLEAWVLLDPALEELLRGAYQADPRRVTRAVVTIIDQARQGALRNPGGLLVRKLREIGGGT